MFAKSDKTPRAASQKPTSNTAARQPSGTVSVISSDLKVLGDLESAGDVTIEGIVEGDVHSKSLTIGQAAHVKGSIYAQHLTIAGKITGRVRANNVKINRSAQVLGDVAHESLSIEAGAQLEGRFSREDFSKADVTAKADSAKPAKAAAGGNGLSSGPIDSPGMAAAAGR